MEEILLKPLAIVLIGSCGFLLYEAVTKGKVRVKGSDKFFALGQWYHWADRTQNLFSYWFWTMFYLFGAGFGVYMLLSQ